MRKSILASLALLLLLAFPGIIPVAAAPGFVWGTAELIETDLGQSLLPQVAVDPQGNVVAVWEHGDGTFFRTNIRANRFVSGVGWGTAELIVTDADGVLRPQVAVDAAGNAVAVWGQMEAALFSLWASRFVPGVGWGTAELIETDDAGNAGSSQVAVDPQGNATVVWVQHDGTRNNIWANRFIPGVGWGTAELIETDDAGDAVGAQVAVDSNGNVTAVWEQHDGTRNNIWANRFIPGVGWGTAELIETDAGGAETPQVAVDPQGSAVAVWAQSGIRTNRFVPGVGWGTAELVNDGGSGPQVAVDPQGNALAVWKRFDGTDNIWANRFVPGLGWGTAEFIETIGGDASRPQVAVDPQGNAVVVWEHRETARFSIWANRFVPGVGWGTAELIETDDAGDASRPQVAVDPQGNAVVVWGQNLDLTGARSDVWANRGVKDDPPALVITSPADGAMLTSTSVAVAGSASDDVGVEKVELSTEGTNWILATGTTSWSGTLTLAEGPNTIFARATDTAVNTATVTIAVTVDSVKPTAAAGEDQKVNSGDTVSFDASASSDDVAIVSYEWDFGDGTMGTGETTTHTYTDPGTYTVTLTVRDAAGNADTDVLIVTVETEPVNPIPPEVVTLGVVGAVAAVAAGLALLLWRRRAGRKEKA